MSTRRLMHYSPDQVTTYCGRPYVAPDHARHTDPVCRRCYRAINRPAWGSLTPRMLAALRHHAGTWPTSERITATTRTALVARGLLELHCGSQPGEQLAWAVTRRGEEALSRLGKCPCGTFPKSNVARNLTFGLGGHGSDMTCEHGHGTSHLSGYDSPESWQRRHAAEDRGYVFPDGCPVVDKRALLERSPGLAFRSPLCRPQLSNGAIDRFDARHAAGMIAGLEGAFGTLAAAAIAHNGKPEPGPLDYVSAADYVAWWAKRGARVGVIQRGQIVWLRPPLVLSGCDEGYSDGL